MLRGHNILCRLPRLTCIRLFRNSRYLTIFTVFLGQYLVLPNAPGKHRKYQSTPEYNSALASQPLSFLFDAILFVNPSLHGRHRAAHVPSMVCRCALNRILRVRFAISLQSTPFPFPSVLDSLYVQFCRKL